MNCFQKLNNLLPCPDDDSEPILGQWFEDTLSPEDATTAPSQDAEGEGAGLEDDDDGERANEKRPTRLSSTDSPCVIPDRRDPEGVSCQIIERI